MAGELWQRLRALPVTIESVRLERREQELPGGFRRATTIVVLGGDGAEGRGEDVTYEPEEHDRFAEATPLDLRGRTTLEDLSALLHRMPQAGRVRVGVIRGEQLGYGVLDLQPRTDADEHR